MSDLIYAVSMPFIRKGKDALKETEFILALSLDLKWFNPEAAKGVLKESLTAGLLKREGELVRPTFDLSKIEIPPEWKPDNSEKKTLFERITDRIIAGKGIEKRKAIAMINKKQENLLKMVEIEVSAILVAVENGVMVDDLIDEAYAGLTTSPSLKKDR